MKDKIYFVYAEITESEFNRRIKYLVNNNNHEFRWKHNKAYGLYAWTTSKKLLNEFLEYRNNDIYTVVKKELLDDYELEKVSKTYSDSKIKISKFYCDYEKSDKGNYVELPVTDNEHYNVSVCGEENMEEFGPKIPDIDYHMFNKKVQEALDTIGYTTDYDVSFSNDDDIAFADNQKSYGLTVMGRKYPYKKRNEFNTLLYLFHFMFFGKTDEINEDED